MHPESNGPAIRAAIQAIQNAEYTCAVLKNGQLLHTASGRGVRPLIQLYDNDRPLLQNAAVADKIIGKGAAIILHLGGAAFVYGDTMSQAGHAYLEANGIPHSWGKLIPTLHDRTGTGTCPIEASVLAIQEPNEGLTAIRATIQKLMAGG